MNTPFDRAAAITIVQKGNALQPDTIDGVLADARRQGFAARTVLAVARRRLAREAGRPVRPLSPESAIRFYEDAIVRDLAQADRAKAHRGGLRPLPCARGVRLDALVDRLKRLLATDPAGRRGEGAA